MQEQNLQTKPLPKINNNAKMGLEDTELFKVEQALELLRNLFTQDNNLDRELEISDLTEGSVSRISILKYFDRVLGFQVYGNLVKDYLRGMFSKNRESRKEVLQAIESLFLEAKGVETESLQKRHKLKKSLNNFVDSFK